MTEPGGTRSGALDALRSQWGNRLAGFGDVAGLRALWSVNDLEFYRLALLERPEAVSLDRREVDEDIAAPVALDESITLGVVEPLDLACDTHRTFPALQWRGAFTRRLTPVLARRSGSGHKKRPRVRGLGLRHRLCQCRRNTTGQRV